MPGISLKYRTGLLVLIVCLCANWGANAQSLCEISSRLDSLYRNRNYGELENYALRSLLFSDSLNLFELAELHKYLGIVYIIQERIEEGRQEFLRWLQLDPQGYLDSFDFPPGIIQVFREAKAESASGESGQSPAPVEQWHHSPLSSLKSICLPGWGQLLQGKSPRGYYLFAAQAACAAGWLVSQHNFELADRAYHLETEAAQFDRKYERANHWNKARWSFFAASLAVYIYAQTDFFLLPPNLSLAVSYNPLHYPPGQFLPSASVQKSLILTWEF